MQNPTSQKIRLQIAYIAVCALVLSVSLFSLWLFDETHDNLKAKDYDFFGRHACPVSRRTDLKRKLPPMQNRPNEDILWSEQIQGARAEFEKRMKSATAEELSMFKQDIQRNFDNILSTESHYRVEVRRTILEMEMGRPLLVHPVCDSWADYEMIEASGLTYHYDCVTDYPVVNYAHDRGRTDTLLWYIQHGIFPSNYHPQKASASSLTQRSTQTLPLRSAVTNSRAVQAAPVSFNR